MSRTKVPKNHFLNSVLKSNCQKSIVEHWKIISSQMIKHQILHTRFDQILLFIKKTMWDSFYEGVL